MKYKKLSALLLTAIISAGLFAGCRVAQQMSAEEKAAAQATVSENAVKETESDSASSFEYPENPLETESMINLVFAAKQRLFELNEISSDMMLYQFGLIDADFDGFPELICIFNKGESALKCCKLYSLKEENFCETILEYKAHDDEGETNYYVKENSGDKSIMVESTREHSDWQKCRSIYELKYSAENSSSNEIMSEEWIFQHSVNPNDYDPTFLRVCGKDVTLSEYTDEYNKATENTAPANIMLEDFIYNCNTVTDAAIQKENHDALLTTYSDFLSEA